MVRVIAIALAVVMAGTMSSSAQDVSPKARPRIGLVLGGGSARGFAHVGVIEWLEEHHIPVDYVTGTSMGGLIGGMYATGMTPAEIRRLIDKTDWEEAFRGQPNYDQLTFRRKEDRREFPNRLTVGLKNGFSIPTGLDPAHPIGLILSRIALHYSTLHSFDELPIPFRCVAADLVSGKSVSLQDGPLAEALRATMAIPGVFTPVERGDMLLVDGGILNNLPTDVARQMGADIVIAVDVSGPLANRKSLGSLTDILGQSAAIMMAEKVRRNLLDADIVIAPKLTGLTGDDFDEGNRIADLGYKSIAAKGALLQGLHVDDTEWHRYLAARSARIRRGPITPRFVEVEPPKVRGAQAIRRAFGKYVGKPLALDALEDDLTAFTGTGRYDSLRYRLAKGTQGDGLLVSVVPKSYGPPFLNMGVDVNGAEPERIGFSVVARGTVFDVGGFDSEWRTDLSLGTRTAVSTEYFHRFGQTPWFIAPRAFLEHSVFELFQEGTRVAEYTQDRTGIGIDLGLSEFRTSELRVGYELSRRSLAVRTGSDVLPDSDGTVSVAYARYSYDGQDSSVVPTRGARLRAEGRLVLDTPGARRSFVQTSADFSGFTPYRRNGALFIRASGGTSLDTGIPVLERFRLGGPLSLGAYDQDQFRGANFMLFNAGYLQKITTLPNFLGGKVFWGGWGEVGTTFDDPRSARYFPCVSTGFIAETILGAFFVGGSIGEGGAAKVYFSLGRFLQ